MRRTIALASFGLIAAASLSAQAPVRLAGARGDFMASFSQLERKFNALATAFPADKYDYAPGKGVRSVCEVLVHVAAENYEMGKAFGAEPAPENLADGEHAKCYADKPTVVAAVKQSFIVIKTGVTNTKDADIDLPFTLFGLAQPRRAWLLSTAEHAGEHLGQLIAYARVNSIVPPWSK